MLASPGVHDRQRGRGDLQEGVPEAGKTASYYNMPADQYKAIPKDSAKMLDFAAQELLENMLVMDQFSATLVAPTWTRARRS